MAISRNRRPIAAHRLLALPLLAAVLAGCPGKKDGEATTPTLTGAISAAPQFLDQGSNWTAANRAAFYSQNQGSQLIPLAWLKVLQTADGQPFLGDQLARYGYLPNPQSPSGLPVGFTVSTWGGAPQAGMTCAACHTRQISVEGKEYRVDGGPALIDFQAFLTDLVAAVGRVRDTDDHFSAFADAVLGAGGDSAKRAELRTAVDLWFEREDALRAGAYPTPDMWGLGRLDAVSMIFNRLTGLDIGPPPSHLITENIQPADAPVRYPFLWNAAKQDKTQWPGFADNGNDLLGLARNTGEVYGVFATLRPKSDPNSLFKVNFSTNSADFGGLRKLEELIQKIGAPKYPWPIDAVLAAKGKTLFEAGCAACHGVAPGKRRFLNSTWLTRIQDVGTDSREYSILARTAKSGSLTGGKIPFTGKTIPATTTAFDLLGFSVITSIVQDGILGMNEGVSPEGALESLPGPQNDLEGAFPLNQTPEQLKDCDPNGTNRFCYESRVLFGIWAAAPYLHNGSVPTLEDLLKPSSQRPATFKLGRSYDIQRLGLAADQPGSTHTLTTTDCTSRDSGNSRCGHEGKAFGTELNDAERTALLEYLKGL